MEQEMTDVGPGTAMIRPPEQVLAEAKKAAVALQSVIAGKKNPVNFNGEQYLEFEDWQVVGRFYGLAAKIVEGSTKPIQVGNAVGYEARAVVVDVRNGIEVSAAEAMCLNDEEKWSSRPKYEWQDELDAQGKKIWVAAQGDKKGYYKGKKTKIGDVPVPMFQLRSMAQTRACAKALRNVLAWVVVMAGYKPTVAEEMTGDEEPGEVREKVTMPARTAAPAPASAAGPAVAPAAPPPAEGATSAPRKISEKQAGRFWAICKSTGKTNEAAVAFLTDTYGVERAEDLTSDVYDKACAWAQSK